MFSRSFIIFLCVIYGYSMDHVKSVDLPRDKEFETVINNTIRCLSNNLKNGIPEHKFPSLEDIFVEDYYRGSKDYLLFYMDGYQHISNASVSGLSSFYAPEIKWVPITDQLFYFDVTFIFKHLKFDSLYDMDVTYFGGFSLEGFNFEDMHIYGNGRMTYDIKNLSLKMSGILKLGSTVNVQNLSVLIKVDDFEFDISGYEYSEIKSIIMSEILTYYYIPIWINQRSEIVSELISPTIENFINVFFMLYPNTETISDFSALKYLTVCDLTSTP